MRWHNIFGKNVPPVSANKSQLGHAMGASSAIEAILAMEGMLRDTVAADDKLCSRSGH